MAEPTHTVRNSLMDKSGLLPSIGVASARSAWHRLGVVGSAMFSDKLDRRRKIHRWALVVAATLLAAGIAVIAIIAVEAFDMLAAAEADRGPVILGAAIAFAGLLVLCLFAYAAVRVYARVTTR